MTPEPIELPFLVPNLARGFTVSHRGATHERNGTPCQDAIRIDRSDETGPPWLVMAVADGHGDSKHDRSQMGAQFAVECACEEVINLLNSHRELDAKLPALEIRSRFETEFPRHVGRRWREKVLNHAQAVDSYNTSIEAVQTKVFSRYGTTLMVSIVLTGNVIVGQIGDGDILFVRNNGDVERLRPSNDHNIGLVTDSLSSLGADLCWRTTQFSANGGELLLLATDGLSDSFVSETEFDVFGVSLKKRIIEFGIAQVFDAMPQWLDHYSHNASGDDISIAIANLLSESVASDTVALSQSSGNEQSGGPQ